MPATPVVSCPADGAIICSHAGIEPSGVEQVTPPETSFAAFARKLHLPDRLEACAGIDGDSLVHQGRILEPGDGPPPHIDVSQKRTVARGQDCARQIRLRCVVDRYCGRTIDLRRTGHFVECGVPDRRGRGSVVLRQNAIHIDAPGAYRKRASRSSDPKGIRCRGRIDRAAHAGAQRVKRAGLDAPGKLGQPLVPVRIELDPTLFHHNAQIVVPGIKSIAAVIETHKSSLTIFSSDK